MNKMSGWIKIHRKFTQWEWYQDSNMVLLFIHLILMANHAPKHWKGISIKRGQLVTGRKLLSKQTGISEQTIRTCLNKLKSTNEITIKSTNKNSIITIVNYEKYQIVPDQSTNEITIKHPTTNQQLTTNKNEKNDKEVVVDTPPYDKQTLKDQFKQWAVESDLSVNRVLNEFELAYDHYKANRFRDANGKPITNLQMSIRRWFKNLNEFKMTDSERGHQITMLKIQELEAKKNASK